MEGEKESLIFYIVTTPQYKKLGFFKLGICTLLDKRISQYQTFSPPGHEPIIVEHVYVGDVTGEHRKELDEQFNVYFEKYCLIRKNDNPSEWYQINEKRLLDMFKRFTNDVRESCKALDNEMHLDILKIIQRPAINSLINFYNSEDVAATLVAPCGAGKTWITTNSLRDIEDKFLKIYIIVPTIPLGKEWMRVINADLTGRPTNSSHEIARNDFKYHIITNKSSDSCIELVKYRDLVIFDEAHHMAGERDILSKKGATRNLIHHLKEKGIKRIALTATPRYLTSSDGNVVSMHDSAYFGKVVYEISYKAMIDHGLLPIPELYIINSEEPDDSLVSKIEILISAMEELKLDHVIVFLSTHKEGEELDKILRKYSSADIFYVSKDSDADKLISAFKKSKHAILINCKKLSEGISIPELQSVAIFKNMTSAESITQTVLRAGRWYPGKDTFPILLCNVNKETVKAVKKVLEDLTRKGFVSTHRHITTTTHEIEEEKDLEAIEGVYPEIRSETRLIAEKFGLNSGEYQKCVSEIIEKHNEQAEIDYVILDHVQGYDIDEETADKLDESLNTFMEYYPESNIAKVSKEIKLRYGRLSHEYYDYITGKIEEYNEGKFEENNMGESDFTIDIHTRFRRAIEEGDIEALKTLDFYDSVDIEGGLHYAISLGRVEVVEVLLDMEIYDTKSLILTAIKSENFDVLELLLSKGKIEKEDYDKFMSMAEKSGNDDLIKLLIRYGDENYKLEIPPEVISSNTKEEETSEDTDPESYSESYYEELANCIKTIIGNSAEEEASRIELLNDAAIKKFGIKSREYIDFVLAEIESYNEEETYESELPVEVIDTNTNVDVEELNKKMAEAAKIGDVDMVRSLIENGANDFVNSAFVAAKYGHLNMVKYLMENGNVDLEPIITYAAEGGHMHIIEHMIEIGSDDFETPMFAAAASGHIDIVINMLERGAKDLNLSLRIAAESGNKDIVKLLIENGASEFSGAITSAARNKRIDIVALLKKAEKNYIEQLKLAGESGNVDTEVVDGINSKESTVNSTLVLNIKELNEKMTKAAEVGNVDMVLFMIENGANDFDHAMIYASGNGHSDIVNLMIKKGADSFNAAMLEASEGGHIDIVCLMIKNGAKDYNGAMSAAAKGGHIDIVRLMIVKGADRYNGAMCHAAGNGHINIVHLMMKEGTNNYYNNAMRDAAKGGHIEIVKLMLESGAEDYNDAMRDAAKGGHIEIVKLMIKNGAEDYNNAMSAAAGGGHIEIVKLMLENGAEDYNNAMSAAAGGGHIEIVKLMLEKGAKDYNGAMRGATGHDFRSDFMRNASSGGHINIVSLMIEKGANDYDGVMRIAARDGHNDIVLLMIEKGANNYRWAMDNAASGGHINIVSLMIEKGANDYDGVMRIAARDGHIDIVSLMIKKGANDYSGAFTGAINGVHIDIVLLILEKGSTDYFRVIKDVIYEGKHINKNVVKYGTDIPIREALMNFMHSVLLTYKIPSIQFLRQGIYHLHNKDSIRETHIDEYITNDIFSILAIYENRGFHPLCYDKYLSEGGKPVEKCTIPDIVYFLNEYVNLGVCKSWGKARVLLPRMKRYVENEQLYKSMLKKSRIGSRR